MYKRTLDLTSLLKKKSFFLLGPRGTGKTTLIRNTLADAFVIDLLEIKTYREYLRNPSIIAEQKLKPIVVIDEVQKLPEILDEVHRMIEARGLTFLLTGSSARKLKRGGANLLAGRGEIMAGSELFGKAFEHFILLEVRAFLSYARKAEKMHYWRSTSQFEVDLILGNCLAVEIKSAVSIQSKHLCNSGGLCGLGHKTCQFGLERCQFGFFDLQRFGGGFILQGLFFQLGDFFFEFFDFLFEFFYLISIARAWAAGSLGGRWRFVRGLFRPVRRFFFGFIRFIGSRLCVMELMGFGGYFHRIGGLDRRRFLRSGLFVLIIRLGRFIGFGRLLNDGVRRVLRDAADGHGLASFYEFFFSALYS
jgi:hypothetical protein